VARQAPIATSRLQPALKPHPAVTGTRPALGGIPGVAQAAPRRPQCRRHEMATMLGAVQSARPCFICSNCAASEQHSRRRIHSPHGCLWQRISSRRPVRNRALPGLEPQQPCCVTWTGHPENHKERLFICWTNDRGMAAVQEESPLLRLAYETIDAKNSLVLGVRLEIVAEFCINDRTVDEFGFAPRKSRETPTMVGYKQKMKSPSADRSCSGGSVLNHDNGAARGTATPGRGHRAGCTCSRARSQSRSSATADSR